MAIQCNLCGLHIPDGVSSCMMCGNKNFAPAGAGATISPKLPSQSAFRSPSHASFSKWLWVVAISLILAPVLRVLSIVSIEIPRLMSDSFRPALESHPGLAGFLYFQIIVNSLLVASALVLNFLFYTKRKAFPNLMVAYVAVTVVFIASRIIGANSLFPESTSAQSYIVLVRYLIWAGAMIPYLLTSSDVKNRFVN